MTYGQLPINISHTLLFSTALPSSIPFSLPLYLELFIDSAYFCISTRSYNFKDRDYFHNVNTLHSAWHFVVIQTPFVLMN